MKKNVICLSARQKQEVAIVLESEATKKGAPLHFVTGAKRTNIDMNIPGEKQKENTELALTVLDHIMGFTISDSAIREGLRTVKWHGRNQIIQKNPNQFHYYHKSISLNLPEFFYQFLIEHF